MNIEIMKKCTPICTDNCQRFHHPLLKALIDAVDDNSLSTFKEVLNELRNKDAFNVYENLEDQTSELSKPILHLAAALGKINVLELLRKKPFNFDPTKSPSDDSQTALHYSLLIWKMKEIYSLDALQVVEHLKSCLDFINDSLETPLHICASNLLSASKTRILFWRSILQKMLDLVNEMKLEDILNCQDQDGNTVLHILSKKDSFLDIVGHLLSAGADLRIKNKDNENPVDIAKRSSPAIYDSFNMILNEIGVNQFYRRIEGCKTRNSRKVKSVKEETIKIKSEERSADEDDDVPKSKRPRIDSTLAESILADQQNQLSQSFDEKPCSSKCSLPEVNAKKEHIKSNTSDGNIISEKEKIKLLREEISDIFKGIFDMYKVDS